MTISVVQHKATYSNASSTQVALTVAATGAGNLLVAGCSLYNAGTRVISGVSDGTNNFTQVPSAASGAVGLTKTDIWYLPVSASGKTTITLTATGTADTYYKSLWLWEVSGFTNPVVDAAGAGAAGTPGASVKDGISINTGASGFAVGVSEGYGITGNPKSGNEFTAGGDLDGSGAAGCSLIYSSAGAHQPVWQDVNNTAYATSTAAFKEGAVASSGFFAFFREILQEKLRRRKRTFAKPPAGILVPAWVIKCR